MEVLYLRGDASSDPPQKKDVSDRFEEIDDLFGDDLADETNRAPRRKRLLGGARSQAKPTRRTPSSFPGVTFVEVFSHCRRSACRVCQSANGASKKTFAVAHPLDEFEGEPGPPTTRRPAPSAKPDERPQTPSPAPRPASPRPQPAAASPPTKPFAPAPSKSPSLSWNATRPAAAAKQEPSTPEPSPPETPGSAPASEKPAPGRVPATRPAPRPAAASRQVASREVPDEMRWDGRLSLDGHGFDMSSDTGARRLERHGTPVAAKPSATEEATEDLNSRLDRILQRAARIGFRPVASSSDRSGEDSSQGGVSP